MATNRTATSDNLLVLQALCEYVTVYVVENYDHSFQGHPYALKLVQFRG